MQYIVYSNHNLLSGKGMSVHTQPAASATALPEARHFIGGEFVEAQEPGLAIQNPANGQVIGRVPMAGPEVVNHAVSAAAAALPSWQATPLKERVQVFFRYRELLLRHRRELAALITLEHGKTEVEALAEIDKAVELTEFACSLPQVATGEVLEVSRGVECRIERVPVGVVASIAPFNFPSMVPHWTIPNAIALGNCLLLKPSELVPLSAGRIAELLHEAGLPPGVFSVVNGARPAAEAICDHPGIAAVSFVGSTAVAREVYRRATGNLKRALALGGAKNHLIVLPDADVELTATNAVASMSGCTGQRCMAASVMVAVRGSDPVVERMVEHAAQLVPGINLGPVISRAALERIERHIADAVAAGARLLLDGRRPSVPGREHGFWIGPTILDQVTPDMRIAQDEVFGPVLAIVRAPDLAQALAIENASPYGNAAAVYTENGALARQVAEHARAGMIGVNVGVPVPREPFSFGGWNDSKFGTCDITGRGSIEFWTRSRKVTTKWTARAGTNWMS